MLRYSGKRNLNTRETGRGFSFRYLLLFICLAAGSACRQDMQDQPKMKPFRGTTFFRDGLSSRPPVEGTVPRGFLKSDTEFFTGKKSGTPKIGRASCRE